MRYREALSISFRALRSNKSRSGLTILGIVIGIASIMLIMSIGDGAQGVILNEMGAMGAETIVIRPGQEPSGPSDFGQTLFSDSLINRDVDALRRKDNVPHLASVSPAVIVPGSVSYQGETFTPIMFGWTAEAIADMFNIYPEKGVIFDEDDIKRKSPVVMIGNKVKEELFGESDALGQSIQIKNKKFRVVGIFPEKGQVSFFNIDELVLLPYTSAQDYLLGIDHFHEVIVKADNSENVDQTVRDITMTLREMHGITDPKKDDFFVVTQQAAIEQIRNVLGTLTVFLAAVVGIALVVGGVGVMNIMLVSVTERTREIGLRKAVGAKNSDILIQFLIESVVLTFLGGLIGVVLGVSLSFVISIILTNYQGTEWPFSLPILAAVISTAASSAVGLMFGIYPARLAARKNPIEALRYE